jgi:hypothetical protein
MSALVTFLDSPESITPDTAAYRARAEQLFYETHATADRWAPVISLLLVLPVPILLFVSLTIAWASTYTP